MNRPLDLIALRGLRAAATHGVLDEEHRAAQPFLVDLALWVDAAPAASSDNIADTVSYSDIADEVVGILMGPSVCLIETLGERIARAVLAHAHVRGVEVTVHKPNAPIAHSFRDVSVTVRRGQIGVLSDTGGYLLSGGDEDELRALKKLTPTGVKQGAASGRDEDLRVRTVPSPEPPDVTADTPFEHAEPVRSSRVVLALGGNIGDAPTTLARALETLIDDERVEIVGVSPLLRTKPVLVAGQSPQADYWNAVVLLDTTLGPRAVLSLARTLEAHAHRERHEHWGPRTLDVDIIDYAGLTLNDPELILPHPRAATRAFVLAPWLMVDPAASLGGRLVRELLEAAPDRGGIIDAVDEWYVDPSSIIAESDGVLAARAVPFHQAAARNESASSCRSGDDDMSAAPSRSARASAPWDAVTVTDRGPQPPASPQWGGPSRLDLVPEESRIGLAPSANSDDLVWKRLWERWGEPTSKLPDPMGPARDQTRGSAPLGSRLSVDRPAQLQRSKGEANSVAQRESRAVERPRAERLSAGVQELQASVRGQSDSERRSHSAVPSHEAPPAERTVPSQAEAKTTEKLPKWLPLVEGAGVHTHPLGAQHRAPSTSSTDDVTSSGPNWDAADSGADDDAAIELAPRSPRRLPSWDFARTDVRIVDEPGALSDIPTPAPASTPTPSVETTIVDPQLPEGTPRGPRSHTERPRALRRSIVVRPSTTGPIPIVKDRDTQ